MCVHGQVPLSLLQLPLAHGVSLRSHYIGFKVGSGADLEPCWILLKIMVTGKGTYLEMIIGFQHVCLLPAIPTPQSLSVHSDHVDIA